MLLDVAGSGSNQKDEGATALGNRVSMTAVQFCNKFEGVITQAISLHEGLMGMYEQFREGYQEWSDQQCEAMALELAPRMPAIHRWHRHRAFQEMRKELALLVINHREPWWKLWRSVSMPDRDARRALIAREVERIRLRRRTSNRDRARELIKTIADYMATNGWDLRTSVRQFQVHYEGNANWANETNGGKACCPPTGINVSDLDLVKRIEDMYCLSAWKFRCEDQAKLLTQAKETLQVVQHLDDNAVVYCPVGFIDTLLTFKPLVSLKFFEAMKGLKAFALEKINYTLDIPLDAISFRKLEAQ
jgi:hypothetical protein